MHLSDGEIRAFLDGESAAPELATHLEQCPACQERLQALSARRLRLEQQLDGLAVDPARTPLAGSPARQRFEIYMTDKEKTPMLNKIFARPYRPAWITLGVIAVLALSLAFSPVRAIANSFLGLFRVQQITVVQVNPGNLPEQLGSSSQLETFITDSLNVEKFGEEQAAADASEATSLAGFAVRLPSGLEGERILKVQPGGRMTFTVDLPRLQAILDEVGYKDLHLPEELNGATVTVDVPKSVTAMYGDCAADLEAARQEGYSPDSQIAPRLSNCTTLIQMPSPEVNAPPGLNVSQIGEAYLQLLGMTADEARQFASTVDWTSTFVIPIPRTGTTSQTVSVDGVDGTYIQQNLENRTHQYLLMWVKDGLLYALTGPGKLQDALSLAGTIK